MDKALVLTCGVFDGSADFSGRLSCNECVESETISPSKPTKKQLQAHKTNGHHQFV
jgi:hypothetical protein